VTEPHRTVPAPLSLGDRPVVRIGRAADNDLVLADFRVSRHHAEVRRRPDGTWEIVDLGSRNGTYLGGEPVTTATLSDGDFIGIGGETIAFADGQLRVTEDRRSAWFGAVDLVVNIDGMRILDEVGFALEPASVLAVIGPSGSGKSTFLNALTGFRPADSGQVVFDGRDVYATYDQLRLRMGLVPQADILHTQLTVQQALDYAAELRFPPDVTKAMRSARIDEVMDELNLSERANLRIDRLSGGQRKRVSVACELLTEPSLLFLDEPTSGLDPGNEAVLMEMLRDLARAGRTIVVVTHSVQSLELCDRLVVLAPGGRLAYYGPPSEALEYFERQGGGSTYAEMFRALEEQPDTDWKGRFRADPAYAKYVQGPLDTPDLEALPPRPNIDPPPPPTPVGRQLQVLIRRYLAVIRADRGFAIALAIQAPVFGLLFAQVMPGNVMNTAEALNASVLIWLIVLGATWLGTSNAIREIVKELPIYRRERSIGLSAGAYVASKAIVLGVITAIQAMILVPLAMSGQILPPQNSDRQSQMLIAAGRDPSIGRVAFDGAGSVLPSQIVELIVVCIVVGLAGMALGLLVSSLAGSLDRASTLLPIILVAQVIVSAPLFVPKEPVLTVLSYALSADWGMAAAASTVELQDLRRSYVALSDFAADRPPSPDRATWNHTVGAWLVDMTVLFVMIVGGLVATWLALRRTDPDLMEGRHPGRRGRRWFAFGR
jgi:ABC-type multidrug transport system ATPase subunit